MAATLKVHDCHTGPPREQMRPGEKVSRAQSVQKFINYLVAVVN